MSMRVRLVTESRNTFSIEPVSSGPLATAVAAGPFCVLVGQIFNLPTAMVGQICNLPI
jgi:hypothetical protein